MSRGPEAIAIRVASLSKKYRLFDSPRQRLREALDLKGRSFHKEFWALSDVSFEIKKGQTVGIIGRNGSGKSTLLQVLTGVMPPTSGAVEVNGRVAALLQLGAGFDPSFTGRDNARQYGRLQGLTADEIEARVPEIEAFANIGEFFDREVRSYSSGMFARLAFAAAINVDPDILILDEILAVGDARFQQRCYERIQRFQESGRTVLIVSHDIETIINQCDSAILIENGRVAASGAPRDVADRYKELLFDEVVNELGVVRAPTSRSKHSPNADDRSPWVAELLASADGTDRFPRRPGYNPQETVYGNGDGQLLDYRIEIDGTEVLTDHFLCGSVVRFHVLARSQSWHDELHFGIAFRRADGIFVYGSNTAMRPTGFARHDNGRAVVFSFALKLALQSGDYFLDAGLFRRVGSETVRLTTRRNVVHVSVLNTPHFDGVVDIGVE